MKRLFHIILSVLLLLTTVPITTGAEVSDGERLYDRTAINAVAGGGEIELNWVRPIAKDQKMLYIGQGLPPDDKTMQYFETLGFSSIVFESVEEIEEEDIAVIDDNQEYDVIFVGETASSGDIGQKFMNVSIPVIYSKGWVLNRVNLSSAAAGDFGDVDGHTSIDIKDPDHPLSAGLNGTVDIYSSAGKVNFGTPGDEAIIIATIEGDDSKSSIFAYEEGAENVNGDPVPARRVSTFLFAGQEDYVTENGWKLLEEAVIWALDLDDDVLEPNETYNIKRSTSAGGPYEVVEENASGTSYTDTDVQNGTTYYYLVTMLTEDGEFEVFSELNATPIEPLETPTGLEAFSRNGEVEISWESVEGATSYDVKRSTNDDSFELLENVDDLNYIDTNVENDTTYYYVISAKSEITSSKDSLSVSATPTDTRPFIIVDESDMHVNEEMFTISGSIDREATVTINGNVTELDSDLNFVTDIQLNIGENIIEIVAIDENDEQRELEINVIYDIEPPILNMNELEGTSEDGYYATTYNPYAISGNLNEPGIVLINDQAFNLDEDLEFNEEIALEPGVINQLIIVGVDLAGNRSEEVTVSVMPAEDAVPLGPIKIESSVVREPHIIEVTFNGIISNFDENDLELQVALGDWNDLNPRLTANFNIRSTERFINEENKTVVRFEIEEALNMDGTINRIVIEDPQRVPYLRASYYSEDLEKSIEQANNLLTWQMDHGGWDKNRSDNDYAREWDGEERKSASYSFIHNVESGTIDNDATIDEILFLSLMYKEVGDERYKDAALRGINYILESQYETGGFPQVYPLVGGYPDAVTYNDNAMVRVLNVLTLISEKKYPFNTDIVSDDLLDNINDTLDLSLNYLLNSQIVVDGELTAWGQQHDPLTYEPVIGRPYEHPSISGSESIGIIKYLMSLPNQTKNVQEAIESALNWYDEVKLEGVRYVSGDSNNQYFYEDPESTSWYRFYQIGTNLPIFSGRDGVIKHDILDIEQERRDGYQWAGSYASELLRIANTTGYYEDRAYVTVVNNNSTNISNERLIVGDIHRIEAYEESDGQDPNESDDQDPGESDDQDPGESDGQDPDESDDQDPGESDGQDLNDEDDQDESVDPDKQEKEAEDKKLPKTATNIFNWIIFGVVLIGLAAAIYSYQKIRQKV